MQKREGVAMMSDIPGIQEWIERVSDIHIHSLRSYSGYEFDEEGSIVFPDIQSVRGSPFLGLVRQLHDMAAAVEKPEYVIRMQQPKAIFRVQRVESSLDGVWFRLRKMSNVAPDLGTLPSRMPRSVEALLLSPHLLPGGLILVSGQPGSGKTTTACAIVSSRLKAFGGFAYTVEDPPEILAMNGWHEGEKRGFCTQNQVYDGPDGWERSIKDVLRSQPVNTNLILYVGEIRTAEAARTIIRAASNGFLVVTTTFATDIISALDTLRQLIGVDYMSSLAAVLRVVLYQRIRTEGDMRVLDASVLASSDQSSRLATMIRSGKMAMVKDELIYQTNQMRRGENVLTFA